MFTNICKTMSFKDNIALWLKHTVCRRGYLHCLQILHYRRLEKVTPTHLYKSQRCRRVSICKAALFSGFIAVSGLRLTMASYMEHVAEHTGTDIPVSSEYPHTDSDYSSADTEPDVDSGDMPSRWRYLKHYAPVFPVNGDDITVLTNPGDFYNTIISEVGKATRRIVISSLYLGTGSFEDNLVAALRESQQTSPQIKIHVLLDYIRGSRGSHNSRTMLLPLLQSAGARVSLYHSPDLRGLYRWLPDRYNETVGVQHMKIYLFDDTLIISGANLSDIYFTNRQDRYIVIRNAPELCDFCQKLVEAVASVSFSLDVNDDVTLPPEPGIHPFSDPNDSSGSCFKRAAQAAVEEVIRVRHATTDTQTDADRPSSDTWICPLVQMGPLGVDIDEEVTTKLFKDLPAETQVHLASGYFNLTEDYCKEVINANAHFSILTAAPQANGFYGAAGLSGAIPSAYSAISRRFLARLEAAAQQHRVGVYEYLRTGWTFHGKGLWAYLPGQVLPSFTLVGSPNFGYRSVHRDLELQLALVTENPQLQQQLHHEQLHLYSSSSRVNVSSLSQPDRLAPLWVRFVTRFFAHWF